MEAISSNENSKKEENEDEIDYQNSMIYWLRKIYEKMEIIEAGQQTNNEILK